MSTGTKIILGIVGLVAVLISVFIVRTYSAAGQYTSLPKYGTQTCSPLAKVAGVEDIAIDRQTGRAFFSSLNRRSPKQRGDIYVMNLNKSSEETRPTAMMQNIPEEFTPSGISYFRGESGIRRLFVINRPKGKAPSVELFNIVGDKLEFVKSISSPLIQTPENLVAIGLEQFYLTNNGLNAVGVIQSFLDFANQKQRGNVIYFDGTVAKEVARDFVSPNGIAKSNDGKTIYVNDMHARQLNFYARAEDNSLSQIGDLFVGTGLDNIDVDDKGHIWIAAHPKLFDHYRLIHGSGKPAPSQIIEAVPGDKEGGKMRTVFLDQGTRLSGSSIGVRFNDRVFISGAYETKVLACDIPVWEESNKK